MSHTAEAAQPARGRRLETRRRRRIDWLPYALIAPIALLLIAITVYPTVYAVYLAMTDASLLRLARAQFIGLGNLVRMADDTVFLDGLWRTLRWDVAVVSLELAIALPIALFLNQTFRCRGIVRAAVMVPYITPPAVVALLFCYMFDGNFGVINDLLVRVGVLDRYVAWLSDPTGSFWVVVSAMVWYGQPLMALILLAALQTIPPELYEAARVDGAGALSRFLHITLPQLASVLFIVLLLRTIWMFTKFDTVWLMTQGGGAEKYIRTLPVYAYLRTFHYYEAGTGAAASVVMFLLLVVFAAVYFAIFRREEQL